MGKHGLVDALHVAEDSAREVEIAAQRGYRGLKCKARAFYDVVEQAEAMQQVAPEDFRIEFDFNGALISVEKALPVLRVLEHTGSQRSRRAHFRL